MIEENLRIVSEKIEKACLRSGRKSEEVTLIAVSKTYPLETIESAYQSGLRVFGESKIQEAETKILDFKEKVSWHLIGHLQTNKAKKAVKFFELIHSVDNFKLAKELDKFSKDLNKKTKILLQVNVSEEQTKSGVSVVNLENFAEEVSQLNFLQVCGLMTIGKNTENTKEIRKCFVTLRKELERLNSKGIFREKLTELSMGMSGDFEFAIEEGATLVRIGTMIFGNRNYNF
ncbi:YggS family pyridoxal phosphate-dependent enzyme [bacterium]|nr:YggS family pyridoxal phosphate-dependent enzyme [bacterium]